MHSLKKVGKMKTTPEELDLLKKYTWGLGIEHEMHIFHKPAKKGKAVTEYTLFDSHSVVEELLRNFENNKGTLSYDEYEFLKKVPFEKSGRECNGKFVIERVPIKMPEFITDNPFCSIEKDNDLYSITRDITANKERFYDILMRHHPKTAKLVKKYGALTQYPYGMTRYLKCPKSVSPTGVYSYEKNLMPEYNGSYHITLTLPFTQKTSQSRFIRMHQNFCNQLQWIEPLLLTAYFSGDEYAPGSMHDRVRGSFRVMIIGWGNFAGSDVRLFDKMGIGRYAKTPTYWRRKLTFLESDRLAPCLTPSPVARREGAISTLSSDFRTFGATDISRPEHRESGVPMTKPNGVEFRIFDHFQDKYIHHLVVLMALVAENSRKTETQGYVYQNKEWIGTMHAIMKDGYKARLSPAFIKLLREKLRLPIKTTSLVAVDIFKCMYEELWNKNINGKWSKIFHGLHVAHAEIFSAMIFPNVNQKSWQFAFMTMCNRDAKTMKSFNHLTKWVSTQEDSIPYEVFHRAVLSFFGENWECDVEDLAYFYGNFFHLRKNKDGSIHHIKVVDKKSFAREQMLPLKNFNIELVGAFHEDDYSYNIGIFNKSSYAKKPFDFIKKFVD